MGEMPKAWHMSVEEAFERRAGSQVWVMSISPIRFPYEGRDSGVEGWYTIDDAPRLNEGFFLNGSHFYAEPVFRHALLAELNLYKLKGLDDKLREVVSKIWDDNVPARQIRCSRPELFDPLPSLLCNVCERSSWADRFELIAKAERADGSRMFPSALSTLHHILINVYHGTKEG